MHLKLDIEQDAELRSSIKKLIEQQIKSIVREEFSEIVHTEIKKKMELVTQKISNNEWRSTIQTSCDRYIHSKFIENGLITWSMVKGDLEKSIVNILESRLDDRKFNALVEKAANEKLMKLINK